MPWSPEAFSDQAPGWLFSKRQRVAPRGKPSRVQAKAVVGRSAQNGRNGGAFPEKYCGYFSFEAAADGRGEGM
jgi:hypothetical protein